MTPPAATAAPALPPELQPWHPWLQWFEPQLAAQLGELVRRLHPLLGRFRGRRQHGTPEPDGVGGLHSRGPYERLLASEWLLADDLPDEFLRRAAMGEHLFLAPQPRGRQAERLIVALFDAGPLQLGAPRLVHLAVWILLARRALAARGELRWGLLQAPGELHPADGAQRLLRLLDGRCFEPATAVHAGRWSDAFAGLAAPPAECWWVGPERQGPAAPLQPSHQVRVQRSLSGDALEVALAEQRSERALQLPLPRAAAGAALLKGGFHAAAAVPHHQHPQRLSQQRAPVFSPQGHLVAVPLLDAPGVAVFPVPRAPHHQASAPRRQQWAAGAQALAACFVGKQIGAVLSDATHLFFWHMRGLAAQPRPPREQFHAPPGLAAWLPSAWLRQGGTQRLCVLDLSGRLVCWQISGAPMARQAPADAWCAEHAVCGMAQYHDGSLVYVSARPGMLSLGRVHASGEMPPDRVWVCEGPADAQVHFAGGLLWSRGLAGCAVRLRDAPQELWRINHPPDPGGASGPSSPGTMSFDSYPLELPPGWRGVGLLHDPSGGGYALLALSADRLKLHRIGQRHQELLFTAPARVRRHSVCPNTGRVALLTADHRLVVVAAAERAVRLLVSTGAAHEAEEAHEDD
jgi:hypothetical protein